MECPGRFSLYSEIRFVRSSDDQKSDLSYSVSNYDQRFSLVSLQVKSSGFQGQIKTFLRSPPISQASCSQIKDQIPRQLFAARSALIVGGSRGIGEVFAKVLALGGAEVLVSYCQAEEKARRIIDDISSCSGNASMIRYDVTSQADFDFAETIAQKKISHLYYMATPPIFNGNKKHFSYDLFGKFNSYYINGFLKTLKYVGWECIQEVFYPSTQALNDLPSNLAEYASSKSAGEALCLFLTKKHPKVRFLYPRLPRMETDQTKSFLPVKNLDPLPIVFKILGV
jgi:hypothetical protein